MEGVLRLMGLLLTGTVSAKIKVDLSQTTYIQMPDHNDRNIFPVGEHIC